MHKTYAGVELLGLGVALVYEQTYCRQSQGACLVYGSLDELRGNALAAVFGLHTDAVDIEFASLGFVVDGREVTAKAVEGLSDERLTHWCNCPPS